MYIIILFFMKYIAEQIFEKIKQNDDCLKSVIVVQNTKQKIILQNLLHKIALQKSEKHYGLIPKIICCKIGGTNNCEIIASLLDYLKQHVILFDDHVKQEDRINLIEYLINGIKFCERFGGNVFSPPFDLAFTSVLSKKNFEILQNFSCNYIKHDGFFDALSKGLEEHYPDDNVFSVTYPPVAYSRSYEKFIKSISNRVTVLDFAHHVPENKKYYEFEHIQDEVNFITENIKTLITDGEKIAIISDNENFIFKIRAELYCNGIDVNDDDFSSNSLWTSCVGSLIFDSAMFLEEKTTENYDKVRKNNLCANVNSSKNLDDFSSYRVNVLDNFNSYIKIHTELLIFILGENYNDLLSVKDFFEKLTSFDIISDLTYKEYCNLLRLFLKNYMENSANYDAEKKVLLLKTSSCFDHEYDIAFMPNLSQNEWFFGIKAPFFLNIPSSFQDRLEKNIFYYILNKKKVFLTRTADDEKIIHRLLDCYESIKIKPREEEMAVSKPIENIFFVPLDKRIKKLTPSKIKDFIDNPYVFYAKYILKLFPETHEDFNRALGAFGHEILQNYFSSAVFGLGLIDFSNNFYSKTLVMTEFERKTFLHILSKPFELLNEKIEKEIPDVKVYHCEENFSFREICNDVEFEILCRVDRLDEFKNGGYNIVDYKNSAYNLKDLVRFEKKGSYNKDSFQLRLNALIFSKNSIAPDNLSIECISFKVNFNNLIYKKSPVSPNDLINTEKFLYEILEEYSAPDFCFICKPFKHNDYNLEYKHLFRLE